MKMINNTMKKREKKGQVTIFIIIAIAIIAVAVLIYMFYPKLKSEFSSSSNNPYEMLQSCLQDDLTAAVNTLSLKGGSVRPEHYIVYNSENIEYLCYTSEFYKTCVMQQPMLKAHIEKEIELETEQNVKDCFKGIEEAFNKKGYSVNLKEGGTEVELLPKRIVIRFNHTMILSKSETETYGKFSVVLNNNLYELISIANSILNFEARYGDAETTAYMNYYHDLKVEKKKQIEGSKIYILTDSNTGSKFQFASRSVAWPQGYE
jgi:hypothetical protein